MHTGIITVRFYPSLRLRPKGFESLTHAEAEYS